jgi:hypothetical protein
MMLVPLMAAAAVAAPAQCSLLAPPHPRTFAVALPGGARATVVDQYGGAFQRNRLFVQWTVRVSRFSRVVPVTSVEFVVDGRVAHVDDTVRARKPGQASFEWATLSRRFAAGDHQLVIRLHERGGDTREIEIPFSATDCPFATFYGEALRKPQPLAAITWDSAFENEPGPDLASVAATLRSGARLGRPRARPGAAVGDIEIARRTATLTAPRSGDVLLRAGGLKVTLDVRRQRVSVTGLAPGTTSVTLRLRAGILRVTGCSRVVFDGELVSAAGDRVTMRARDVRRCAG